VAEQLWSRSVTSKVYVFDEQVGADHDVSAGRGFENRGVITNPTHEAGRRFSPSRQSSNPVNEIKLVHGSSGHRLTQIYTDNTNAIRQAFVLFGSIRVYP
jgi:hypothetical protein